MASSPRRNIYFTISSLESLLINRTLNQDGITFKVGLERVKCTRDSCQWQGTDNLDLEKHRKTIGWGNCYFPATGCLQIVLIEKEMRKLAAQGVQEINGVVYRVVEPVQYIDGPGGGRWHNTTAELQHSSFTHLTAQIANLEKLVHEMKEREAAQRVDNQRRATLELPTMLLTNSHRIRIKKRILELEDKETALEEQTHEMKMRNATYLEEKNKRISMERPLINFMKLRLCMAQEEILELKTKYQHSVDAKKPLSNSTDTAPTAALDPKLEPGTDWVQVVTAPCTCKTSAAKNRQLAAMQLALATARAKEATARARHSMTLDLLDDSYKVTAELKDKHVELSRGVGVLRTANERIGGDLVLLKVVYNVYKAKMRKERERSEDVKAKLDKLEDWMSNELDKGE